VFDAVKCPIQLFTKIKWRTFFQEKPKDFTVVDFAGVESKKWKGLTYKRGNSCLLFPFIPAGGRQMINKWFPVIAEQQYLNTKIRDGSPIE